MAKHSEVALGNPCI